MKHVRSVIRGVVFSALFFSCQMLGVIPDVEPGISIWTISKKISEDLPYPLFQADVNVSTDVLTIDAPGHYLVRENLTDVVINITSDDVILDLDGHEVSPPSSKPTFLSTTFPVIVVSSGYKNITIKNGAVKHMGFTVDSTGTNGVRVESNSYLVTLENLRIFDASIGISLGGTSGNEVLDCSILNCEVNDCELGLLFNYSNRCVASGCRVTASSAAGSSDVGGIRIFNSSFNLVSDCQVTSLLCPASQDVRAFWSSYGSGNILRRCIAEDIGSAGSGDDVVDAYGILLEFESDAKVLDCIVNGVFVDSGEEGAAYGMYTGIGVTDCLIQGNKFINSNGTGLDGDFGIGENVAIQNIAYNNSVNNYNTANVLNVTVYDHTGGVNPGVDIAYDNIAIEAYSP